MSAGRRSVPPGIAGFQPAPREAGDPRDTVSSPAGIVPSSAMADGVLVGLDVGTSAVDACAFSPQGEPLAAASAPLAVAYPRPGWAEQDAGTWPAAALAALRDLAARLGPRAHAVTAIGLSGQCPSFALVDAAGVPLTPGLIYQDNRATAEAAHIAATLGPDAVRSRAGIVPSHFYVAPKALWLGRHQPELRGARPWLAQPRDLVAWRLTGTLATDATHAGCTGLYDLRAGAWAGDWIEALDLAWLRLPPVLAPAAVAGRLGAAVAGEIGLPAGTPVVIGAADNFCSDLALGAVVPGLLGDTTGTSTCLDLTVARWDENPLLALYAHPVLGRYFATVGLNVTGAVVAWAAAVLADGDVAALEAQAGAAPATPTAPLLRPYLAAGERTDAGAAGVWSGLSLAHDRPRLARSVYEGVTFALRELLDAVRVAGYVPREGRLGGGGSRSALWAQLKADIWNLPVRAAAYPDTTALGAALLAGLAIGLYRDLDDAVAQAVHLGPVYTPDPARVALYDALYRRWQAVGAQVQVLERVAK